VRADIRVTQPQTVEQPQTAEHPTDSSVSDTIAAGYRPSLLVHSLLLLLLLLTYHPHLAFSILILRYL